MLTEPAFLVLTALAESPRHGYGILGEVADASEGRVRLRVGTLYGVLDRLALPADAARQEANARLAMRRLRGGRPAATAGGPR